MMSDMVRPGTSLRSNIIDQCHVPFVGWTKCPTGRLNAVLLAWKSAWNVGPELLSPSETSDPGNPVDATWAEQEALWVLNRLDEHRIFFAEAPLRATTRLRIANARRLLIGAAEFATMNARVVRRLKSKTSCARQ